MAEEVNATATATADPVAPAADPTPTPDPVAADPAQPAPEQDPILAGLEEAMKGLPADEPDPVPDPNAAAQVPAEYENLTQISSFVQTPEQVEQAIRAADEVWSVATGEKPARTLLEGMRAANPQGFQAVVNDLVPYLEQVTGKKFGGEAGAPDPVQEQLRVFEQRFQQQEEARQAEIYNQQLAAAKQVMNQKLTELAKGTFFEGDDVGSLVAGIARHAGIPEQQMMQALLSGNTEHLEKAFKAYRREQTAQVKRYSERIIKQYRTLKNAVPASKGAPADLPNASDSEFPAYKEGETPVQYAARVFGQK